MGVLNRFGLWAMLGLVGTVGAVDAPFSFYNQSLGGSFERAAQGAADGFLRQQERDRQLREGQERPPDVRLGADAAQNAAQNDAAARLPEAEADCVRIAAIELVDDFVSKPVDFSWAISAEGVKDFAGLIWTGTKAAFGNEGAQGQLQGVLDYISTPSNWPSLLGAMTPSEREQLAQAYERGDGQAVAIMMGEQATELPMFGGPVKKAGNVAKTAGKVDGAKPQNMADKIIIVDSKGNALIGDWSKTKVLTAPENALAHWQKHGNEFPEITSAAQYVDFAQDFVKNPPPNVLTKTRPNGDVMLYDQTTNTFAVRTASGVPKTIFKLNDGINYWRKQ